MRALSTAFAAAAVLATQLLLSASPAAAASTEFPTPTYASADLSRYRTFAFFEPANDASLPHAPPLTREMVQAARAALEQRGYVYDEVQPELRVNLFAMLVERQKLRVTPVGPAFGRSRIDAVPFHQGTFVVDLVDARHNVLVWRGTAHGRITEQGLNDPAGAIQVAVRGIFSRFPATAP